MLSSSPASVARESVTLGEIGVVPFMSGGCENVPNSTFMDL